MSKIGYQKSLKRELSRFFLQPRILTFKKRFKVSKWDGFIHLMNGFPNVTFPLPYKSKTEIHWFEWSYDAWKALMRERYGAFGENSLRSPTAWWRQVSHSAGGFFMALPLNLIIFFSFDMAPMLLSPMGLVLGFSLWKESKDIKAEGERRKNSVDVVFWVFGAFLNAIFFMIFKDMPF